ncbi:MAG: hypothetical protein ACLRMJ_08430 [Alistipes finegoldii]
MAQPSITPTRTWPETGYPNVTGSNKGVLPGNPRERTIECFRRATVTTTSSAGKRARPSRSRCWASDPLQGRIRPRRRQHARHLSQDQGETPSTKPRSSWRSIRTSSLRRPRLHLPTRRIREWNGARDYYYPIPTDDRSLTGGADAKPRWNDGLDF